MEARLRIVAGAVLVVGLLSACSSGSNKAATTTTTPSATTAAGGGSATTTPGASTTTTGSDRCTTAATQLGYVDGQGATGHFIDVFSVKNTATKSCRVSGYPGVVLLDAAGRVMAQGQRKGGFLLPDRPPTPVTLAPGQIGYFGVESTDLCPNEDHIAQSDRVQVILPEETAPAVVSRRIFVCQQANILVSPVRATQADVTRR